ncbi:MAG: hypothetical protein ACTSVB_04040 [Candidatus Heimdallarchaeaceae archaeon]
MKLICKYCKKKIKNMDEIGKAVHPYKDQNGYFFIIRKYGELKRIESEPTVICRQCYDKLGLKEKKCKSIPEEWSLTERK